MRKLNLLLSSLLICFQYPFAVARWFAFRLTPIYPILGFILLLPLVFIGLFLHLCGLGIVVFFRTEFGFKDIPKKDLVMDALEYWWDGMPIEEVDKWFKKSIGDEDYQKYNKMLIKNLKIIQTY